MKAFASGWCERCKGPVRKGAQIDLRNSGWGHVRCPKKSIEDKQ